MKTNLQALRKEAGFRSANAFAEHLGMSPGTYTDYEQGRRDFALERAWQFADALGEALGRYVSLDELAGRDFPAMLEGASPDELRLLGLYRETDERGQRTIIRAAEGAVDEFARGNASPASASDASPIDQTGVA